MALIFALFLTIFAVFHSFPASNGMYSRVDTAYWANLKEQARERQEVLQTEEDNARDIFKAAHQTVKQNAGQPADSVAVCRYAIAGMQWQQFQRYNEQITFQSMLEAQQIELFRSVYDKIQVLKKGENGTERVLNPEMPLDFAQCLAAYKEFRQQYFADTAVVTYDLDEKPEEMEKVGDRYYEILEIVKKGEPESEALKETLRNEESKARVVFKHEHHNLSLVPHDALEACRCAVAAMQWQIFYDYTPKFIEFTGMKGMEEAQEHIKDIKSGEIGTDPVLHPKHTNGTFEECLGVYRKLRQFYFNRTRSYFYKSAETPAEMKEEAERIYGILGIVESKMERIIHAGEQQEQHQQHTGDKHQHQQHDGDGEEQQKQVGDEHKQHHEHAGDEHHHQQHVEDEHPHAGDGQEQLQQHAGHQHEQHEMEKRH